MKNTIRLIGICAALFTLSCASGLTEEDLNARLAEQEVKFNELLVKKGLIASDTTATSSEDRADSSSNTSQFSDGSKYKSSMYFLSSLDRLMRDYQVFVAPDEELTNMMRCVTDWERSRAPELKRTERALAKKQGQSEEMHRQREAERRRRAWKQYRLDYMWETREDLGPPVFACSCGGQWNYSKSVNSKGRCTARRNCDWRLRGRGRSQGKVYSARPELMTRIETAELTVPERFHCQVSNARYVFDDYLGQSFVGISCSSPDTMHVQLRIYGDQRMVNIGDILSVPLRDAHRDPMGVLYKEEYKGTPYWVVTADATKVNVDQAATCPSRTEILEAAK